MQGFSFLFYLLDFGHGVKAVAGLYLLVALRLEFADLGVELLDLVGKDAEMPSCWGWHPWWSYNLLSGLTGLKRTLLPGYLLKRRLILNPISPLNPAFILLFSLLLNLSFLFLLKNLTVKLLFNLRKSLGAIMTLSVLATALLFGVVESYRVGGVELGEEVYYWVLKLNFAFLLNSHLLF